MKLPVLSAFALLCTGAALAQSGQPNDTMKAMVEHGFWVKSPSEGNIDMHLEREGEAYRGDATSFGDDIGSWYVRGKELCIDSFGVGVICMAIPAGYRSGNSFPTSVTANDEQDEPVIIEIN